MPGILNEPVVEVLADCVATLQRVAGYRLPNAMDRRLLWLGENKPCGSGLLNWGNIHLFELELHLSS